MTIPARPGNGTGARLWGKTNLNHRILFFISVIVLAFLPGGIIVSVLLLALYCFVPALLAKGGCTVKFEARSDPEQSGTMGQYSEDTLEGMR